MNNSPHCAFSIGYEAEYIEETINTKFLGLQIDKHLNWKNRIGQIRSVFHISSTESNQFISHIFGL
jgi:hypothetical protein